MTLRRQRGSARSARAGYGRRWLAVAAAALVTGVAAQVVVPAADTSPAPGKAAAAHKGLVHVAKVMACTAVEVLQDDVLLARAKADHQARVARTPYVCPLPDEVDLRRCLAGRVDDGARSISATVRVAIYPATGPMGLHERC